MNHECCIIEEPLGAVSADAGCRPGGKSKLDVLPSSRPAAPWVFPVPGGYITDLYGWRTRPTTGKKQFHKGLDVGKGEGAAIVAPADGRVTYINQNPSISSGRYLTITHDNGWQSLYLHLLTPAVVSGAHVKAGQRIALMGKTGKLSDGRPAVTGAHLHLIVKDECGNVINPLVAFSGRLPRKGGGSVAGMYGSGGGGKWLFGALTLGGLYLLFRGK
jgi:murein DD-endopeptidase MepM/ murein hydrolase activator NlpD